MIRAVFNATNTRKRLWPEKFRPEQGFEPLIFKCQYHTFRSKLKYLYGLKVEDAGMEVLKKEEKILSKEEAAEFYKQHEGSEHFDQLVEFMSR